MALKGDWSWRSIGISAISAAAGSAMGSAVQDQSWAQVGNGIGQRLAAGLAGGLSARALTSGRKTSYESVFASTLGNAIGESIASQTTQGQGPWSSGDYRNGSDVEDDIYVGRRDAMYGLGGSGARFGGSGGNAVADWSREVDRGIRDKALGLANFDAVSSKVWAEEDAQAAQRHRDMLVGQNARAEAYGRELRQTSENASETQR